CIIPNKRIPMPTLFPIPDILQPPASDVKKLLDAKRYQETVESAERALDALDKKFPMRNLQPPQTQDPASPQYQYYTLTVLLVNAFAAVKEWKAAKEALGKYRVRFPRDPWGFRAGAEVTRRDPAVKDQAAVDRAVELLEGEADRLESSRT